METGSSGEVSKAVTELGEVIRNQVITYKKPLLRQALHVLHMDQWLAHIHQNVQSFNDHFLQVRHDLCEPFNALSEQSKQISKAHKVSHMLRAVHLFMIQLTRLKRTLSTESALPSSDAPDAQASSNGSSSPSPLAPQSPVNLSQAASLVHELLNLVETERLSGIDVVVRETPWIIELKRVMQEKAAIWLRQLSPTNTTRTTNTTSPKESSQGSYAHLIVISTLAEAVQVLYSLNVLGEVLTQVLNDLYATTCQRIASALDVSQVKNIPASTNPSSMSSTASSLTEQRRLSLWSQLEALFRQVLPAHIDNLLAIHRALISLWKRAAQQSPDDRNTDNSKLRADAFDTGPTTAPILGDDTPSSYNSTVTLSAFLRFLIPRTSSNEEPSRQISSLVYSNDAGALVKHFWNDVVETELCESVLRATKKTKQTEQILSSDFPRLLRLFYGLSEHAITQLERIGLNFDQLMRAQRMQLVANNSQISPSPNTRKQQDHESKASSKSTFQFVQPDKSVNIGEIDDEEAKRRHEISDLPSASMVASSAHGLDPSSSKMEILVGENLWSRVGSRLQSIELEYQKVLVAQFFTPINGMFAAGTAPSPTNVSDSQHDSEKWQIFGPLGMASAKNQKGGVVVGGRMLLPGEVILALSAKAESSGSSSYALSGGRWVGGSPYLCKWLSLIKTHFDSLQSGSSALIGALLPKFMMALNKSIKLFVLKTEEVLSHEEDSAQVVEMPPISQRFNAAVYNALASVHSFLHQHILTAVEAHMTTSDATKTHLTEFVSSLHSIATLASQHLLQPIFKRASSVLSKCIFVDMHQTDWQNASETSSLYLRTLTRLVAHLSTYIIPLFTSATLLPSTTHTRTSLLLSHMNTLTRQLSANFTLSASFIRHITENTRIRLMKDILQVEQLCQSLENLVGANGETKNSSPSPSESARILLAFREALFADTASIVSSILSQTPENEEEDTHATTLALNIRSLPAPTLFHLILQRAPEPENISPMSMKNLSTRQYADWVRNTQLSQLWSTFQAAIADSKSRLNVSSPNYASSTAVFQALESIGAVVVASKWETV